MLELRGLYKTDGNRQDCVTIIPWNLGNSWCRMSRSVDALAPSRVDHGSLCKPGTNATKAEARKIEKCRELIDDGYIFQPMVIEVQGSLGECSEIFNKRVSKMLCRSHDEQQAYSLLRQRISMALLFGNAAFVLGSVSDRDAFEDIITMRFFLKKKLVYHCSFFQNVFLQVFPLSLIPLHDDLHGTNNKTNPRHLSSGNV